MIPIESVHYVRSSYVWAQTTRIRLSIRRGIFWCFLFCYFFLCVGVVCIFIASVSPADATKWFYTSLIDLIMTWKLGQKPPVLREAKCLVLLNLCHFPFSNMKFQFCQLLQFLDGTWFSPSLRGCCQSCCRPRF